MRAVVQRVNYAEVKVNGSKISSINNGLLVYLGIGKDDSEKDITYICDKLVNLRIFADNEEKMNLSVKDINGEILLVSQFTLYGDCRKGRRPSFDEAMSPLDAKNLFELGFNYLKTLGMKVESGIFQAHMEIKSINDGPVTMLLDSKKIF